MEKKTMNRNGIQFDGRLCVNHTTFFIVRTFWCRILGCSSVFAGVLMIRLVQTINMSC